MSHLRPKHLKNDYYKIFFISYKNFMSTPKLKICTLESVRNFQQKSDLLKNFKRVGLHKNNLILNFRLKYILR